MPSQGTRTNVLAAVLAATLGIVGPDKAFANTEETVTSRVSGGTPYLIVHEDAEGASRRAPGLYVREGERGNWGLAIPGSVLSPKRSGGFSAQLSLTSRTQRSESIAVLNGRLTLFSVNSRADRPETLVVFGGDSGTKPVDSSTGSEIDVPEITTLEDLSLYHKEVSVGERTIEVILVSVKSRSPLGTGMTFAFALDPEPNKGDDLVLRYAPVLLDWHFQDAEALSRLIVTTGTSGNSFTGLVSANALRRLAQPQEGDPVPVALWRKRIVQALKGQSDQALRPELPLLRVADGKLDIEQLPMLPLQEGALRAVAVYDPVTQQHRLLVDQPSTSLSRLPRTKPFLTGAVDCTPQNCLRLKTVQSSAADSGHLTFVQLHDGTVHALTVAHNLPAAVRILPTDPELAGRAPRDISWYAIPNTSYVVGSWTFPDGKSVTSLYRLEAGAGFLRIVSQLSLTAQFMTPEQIAWRVGMHPLNQGKRVTFDVLTENVTEEERYRELYNKHLPVLDLADSLDQKNRAWFYPEPLHTVTVSSRVRHLRFEPASHVPNPTGFFTGNLDARKPMMGAQLISPGDVKPGEGQEPKWDLDSTVAALPQTRVNAVAMLVDPHFRNGSTSIITVVLTPDSNDYPPSILKLTGNFNHKNLKHFHFLRVPKRKEKEGKKEKAPKEQLLCGFAVFKDRTEVYSAVLNGIAVDGGVKTGPVQHWKIADGPMSPEEIDSRMRFVDGEPYFVTTPQLSDDEREYALISPRNGSTLLPNKDPGHRVVFDDFEDEDRSSYSRMLDTWRVWGSDKRFREITDRVKNATEYDLDVFPDFSRLLEEMATPGQAPRHVFFVVPPALKGYTQDYPFAIFMRQQKGRVHFHSKNAKLQLYLPDPDKAKQGDAVANLKAMAERNASPNARAVLISTLDQVIRMGRPTADHQVNFTINEEYLRQPDISAIGDADETADAPEESPADHPHLLYWLATEGEQVPLAKFDPKRKPKSPIILIGTEDELAKLREQAAMEEKRNLFDHFEVVELSQSTQQIREAMIRRVFESREFRELGYRIDVTDIDRDRDMNEVSQDEARDILCRHMANRIDALAAKHDVPVFTAFMRVVSTLTQQLSSNAKLRRAGVVSRGVTEEILAKVFPIPLHLDLLPPDDPLRKLASPEFVLHWQQTGYDGPVQLKKQVTRTILAQLGNDTVRPVPSSIILYGNTGSGKTFLIHTLLGTLGLKRYRLDADEEENLQAQAFFLEMNRILEHGYDETSQDALTLTEANEHFDRFLSSANGARGFICLDDFHTAPPKVRDFFLKKIRTILENPYYVANGRQIPTRNLTIILTMNATDDQSKIEKYTSDKSKGPTDTEMILATLNDGNQTTIEKSLLRRFGLILNLDRFPTSAKGPALIRSTATAAQGLFTNSGKYVLVTPQVVSGLVSSFPGVNARSFLSAGANALIQIDDRSDNRCYIVVPNPEFHRATGGGLGHGPEYEASGQKEEADIERYVRAAMQKLPIGATPLGKLHLLNFLLNNFRTKLFEIWLRGVSEDGRYFENPDYHQMISIPLAQAVHDHLAAVPEYPLEWLVLNYADLGSSNPNERFGFDSAFQQLRLGQKRPDWRLPPVGNPPRNNYLRSLLEGSTVETGRTRQHVLRDHLEPLQARAREALTKWLYVEALDRVPEPTEWLESLPASEPASRAYERKWVQELGAHLADDAIQYARAMLHPSVSRLAASQEPLSQYDAFRLLCLAIDRAIGRLAWGKATTFVLEALQMATGKLMLGESRGVQQLLFTGKSSPLIAVEPSFVRQMARNLPDYGDPEEDVNKLPRHVRFVRSCDDLLSTASDQEGQP